MEQEIVYEKLPTDIADRWAGLWLGCGWGWAGLGWAGLSSARPGWPSGLGWAPSSLRPSALTANPSPPHTLHPAPRRTPTRYVLLMDPILGTGGSAARAVKVLLDKGVEESKILFLR